MFSDPLPVRLSKIRLLRTQEGMPHQQPLDVMTTSQEMHRPQVWTGMPRQRPLDAMTN